MRTSVYFLTQFIADMSLYMSLCFPSIIMAIIGFRQIELNYLSHSYIVMSEILTKIGFGFVLFPLVYLIGFWKRRSSDNIYKSLG
jgi:hypothetical protein